MLETDIKDIKNLDCLKKRVKHNNPELMHSFYCAYSDSNNPCENMRIIDGVKGFFCAYPFKSSL